MKPFAENGDLEVKYFLCTYLYKKCRQLSDKYLESVLSEADAGMQRDLAVFYFKNDELTKLKKISDSSILLAGDSYCHFVFS